ncbi:hypothetical protein IW262DRAFT_1419938 [Armillaria fumosa]|nr:hypothetical protein IW262DRAFT_1419938 [Armillaria fumosa]
MSFSSTTKIVMRWMRLAVIYGLTTSACSPLTLVTLILDHLILIFHTVHGLAEDSDSHRNPFHFAKTLHKLYARDASLPPCLT